MISINLKKIKRLIIKRWYFFLLGVLSFFAIGSLVGTYGAKQKYTSQASFVCTMSTTKQAMTTAQNSALADAVFDSVVDYLKTNDIKHKNGDDITWAELKSGSSTKMDYAYQEVTISFVTTDKTIAIPVVNVINEKAVLYLNSNFITFNKMLEVTKEANSVTAQKFNWLYYGFAFGLMSFAVELIVCALIPEQIVEKVASYEKK